jgi:hypothetical protein
LEKLFAKIQEKVGEDSELLVYLDDIIDMMEMKINKK